MKKIYMGLMAVAMLGLLMLSGCGTKCTSYVKDGVSDGISAYRNGDTVRYSDLVVDSCKSGYVCQGNTFKGVNNAIIRDISMANTVNNPYTGTCKRVSGFPTFN